MSGRTGIARRSEKQAEPIRALTFFEALPAHHMTLLVDDDSSSPHLKSGEFAVLDTSDIELQKGEVYVIQYESGDRRRRITQIYTGYIGTGTGNRQQLVWWARDLAGWRKTEMFGDIPVFCGMSDGPYNPRQLRKKLLGRVVGYANAPLGAMLEPCLGYGD